MGFSRINRLALCAAFYLTPALFSTARADDAATQPAGGGLSLLQQLDQESQNLVTKIGPSVVRLELPAPNPVLSVANPATAWISQLAPDDLHRLRDMINHAPENSFIRVEVKPAQPSTEPQLVSAEAGGKTNGPPPGVVLVRVGSFTPNGIGIIMDDDQHLIVPHFVDGNIFGGSSIRVQMASGKMATASFVGSDEKLNLTVLKLQDVHGKPAEMATTPPPIGSLLMVMSVNSGNDRLAVWPGKEPDFAAIFTTDAKAAGFTIDGRFIPASAYQRTAHELITYGQARRPVLGVVVEEVLPTDSQRVDPGLGNTPALRIVDVLPKFPADRAGLQKGDLIFSLGGEGAGDKYLFADAISKQSGRTDMTIFRDHQREVMSVDFPPPSDTQNK